MRHGGYIIAVVVIVRILHLRKLVLLVFRPEPRFRRRFLHFHRREIVDMSHLRVEMLEHLSSGLRVVELLHQPAVLGVKNLPLFPGHCIV